MTTFAVYLLISFSGNFAGSQPVPVTTIAQFDSEAQCMDVKSRIDAVNRTSTARLACIPAVVAK